MTKIPYVNIQICQKQQQKVPTWQVENTTEEAIFAILWYFIYIIFI